MLQNKVFPKHCVQLIVILLNLIQFDLVTVFYDTRCCLCSAIVKHLTIKAQNKGIKFLDLEEFKTNNYTNSASIDHTSIDSILFTEAKTISIYSEAVVRLLICLGGIYKIFGCLLNTIPKRSRDGLYKIIAKNRYRIFGIANCKSD